MVNPQYTKFYHLKKLKNRDWSEIGPKSVFCYLLAVVCGCARGGGILTQAPGASMSVEAAFAAYAPAGGTMYQKCIEKQQHIMKCVYIYSVYTCT